jgi:hypothetical protein
MEEGMLYNCTMLPSTPSKCLTDSHQNTYETKDNKHSTQQSSEWDMEKLHYCSDANEKSMKSKVGH